MKTIFIILLVLFIQYSQSANVTAITLKKGSCEATCGGGVKYICIDEENKKYCVEQVNDLVSVTGYKRSEWKENNKYFFQYDVTVSNKRDDLPIYYFNIRADICNLIRQPTSSYWNIKFYEVNGVCNMFPESFQENKIIINPRSSLTFGFIVSNYTDCFNPQFTLGGVRFSPNAPENNYFTKNK